MTEDARFEDGGETPLRLAAEDREDLVAISALLQDAVLPGTEMQWDRNSRRFALLANRFRWEDAPTQSGARKRPFERVQAVLAIDAVRAVRWSGFDPRDKDQVISLLSLTFEDGADAQGGGRIVLTLAGDGAIGVDVEAVSVSLTDVTRPYQAVSGRAPEHPED
ncbi:MAG: DUF2948 family protein [Pseudomonadota bacterium]